MGITKNLERLYHKKEIKSFNEVIEFSEIENRTINIGCIDEEVGVTVEAMIRFWNRADSEDEIPVEKRLPIKIYIDSPGGSLTATLTIIDSIKMSKTPVWTIAIGTSYSGGFFLGICGHRRLCYKNASFLYHEGSAQWGGDAGKFKNFVEFYKTQLEQIRDIVLSQTKISSELYHDKRRDDWWFTSEDAIKYGLVDEIIENFI